MDEQTARLLFWGDNGLADRMWAELKRAADKHKSWDQTPANPGMSDYEKLTILVEEVGEVARAMTYDEESYENRKQELLETATMAGAWMMSMLKDGEVTE